MEAPGDVAFWLRRASVEELRLARRDELAKGWAGLMLLVVAIERELYRRSRTNPERRSPQRVTVLTAFGCEFCERSGSKQTSDNPVF